MSFPNAGRGGGGGGREGAAYARARVHVCRVNARGCRVGAASRRWGRASLRGEGERIRFDLGPIDPLIAMQGACYVGAIDRCHR